MLYHHPLSSTLLYSCSSRGNVADAVNGEVEPSDKVYEIVEKLRSKNILVSSHQEMRNYLMTDLYVTKSGLAGAHLSHVC